MKSRPCPTHLMSPPVQTNISLGVTLYFLPSQFDASNPKSTQTGLLQAVSEQPKVHLHVPAHSCMDSKVLA